MLVLLVPAIQFSMWVLISLEPDRYILDERKITLVEPMGDRVKTLSGAYMVIQSKI